MPVEQDIKNGTIVRLIDATWKGAFASSRGCLLNKLAVADFNTENGRFYHTIEGPLIEFTSPAAYLEIVL